MRHYTSLLAVGRVQFQILKQGCCCAVTPRCRSGCSDVNCAIQHNTRQRTLSASYRQCYGYGDGSFGHSRLPAELLIKILVCVLHDYGHELPLSPPDLRALRSTLSFVCRIWRSVVADTTQFWTSFYIDSRTPLRAVAEMLLRTNVADIRVHMDLVDPTARLGGSRALPLFDAHLDRIVHFEINWARVAVDSPFLTRRLVLPRLRCLRMTNTTTLHDEAQSVVHIAAPALQRLLFDSVTSVDWHNLVSPNLLTLDLCSIYVDMPKLLPVLERCKHLHSLRFTDIEIVGMAMGPYLSGSVPPFQDFLPNLRKFECTQRETNWRGMSWVGIGPFIVPFIPWQQLDNGTFHSVYWHNTTERFVAVLQGIELTYLSLSLEPQGTSGDHEQYVWHFRETLAHGRSNRERRVRLCGPQSVEELSQLAPYFACLVELRTDVQGLMHPIFWDIADPFPHVRTLILELSKEPGSPALADTISCPLPRLRGVHLVHLGIDLLYLEQKTVEDFVRSLGCDAEPQIHVENVFIGAQQKDSFAWPGWWRRTTT